MIIDDQLKLVFIHIPKTGGTSIYHWLKNQTDQTVALWGNKDGIDYAHLTLDQVNRMMSFNLEDYFKFAFVRHPLDRIYSAYLQPYRQTNPKLSFDQFLENYVKLAGKLDPSLVHLWPMYHFVTINGKISVDFIGRLENWSDDISFVKMKCNLSGLPIHLNKNKIQSNYIDFYKPEQIKIIKNIYQIDFDLFGYK